jgi:hypothetical protein
MNEGPGRGNRRLARELTDGNMLGEVIDISQPAPTQASWMRLGAAEIGAARRFGDHKTAGGTGSMPIDGILNTARVDLRWAVVGGTSTRLVP